MVTAVGGYPTQSWGTGGYGFEVDNAAAAVTAVKTLHGLGARLIMLPVAGSDQLALDALSAAVDEAHALGLVASSHALTNSDALIAAQAGCDVLAHTPVEALGQATIAAWSGRVVISSLKAFGGSQSAIGNLKKLSEAGVGILYGTDFGNSQTAGIDPLEIQLMHQAGLSGAQILAAGTSAPAAFWKLDHLGALEVGKAASFLVLKADPALVPGTLSEPTFVYLNGEMTPAEMAIR